MEKNFRLKKLISKKGDRAVDYKNNGTNAKNV
jgi:hypothetical protein